MKRLLLTLVPLSPSWIFFMTSSVTKWQPLPLLARENVFWNGIFGCVLCCSSSLMRRWWSCTSNAHAESHWGALGKGLGEVEVFLLECQGLSTPGQDQYMTARRRMSKIVQVGSVLIFEARLRLSELRWGD